MNTTNNSQWINLRPKEILCHEWLELLSSLAARLYGLVFNSWNYHGRHTARLSDPRTAERLKVTLEELRFAQQELVAHGLVRITTHGAGSFYRPPKET